MNARISVLHPALYSPLLLQNLLRTLTDAKAKAAYPECDLKLLLTTVKDGRRQPHDSKLTDPFYDSLEGLLLDLRTTSIDNHDAEAFLKPVSKAEVPDYYDVITNPMDLQTMLKKVKQKQYKSKREFKDDLDLIWSNCFTYNATETHPLRQCAKRLKLKADRLLRNITDRKERADPVIPAALGGGGPTSSPFPSKPNGAVNGHRLPTITIKPPRKPFNDTSRKSSFSTGTVLKREPTLPFAEMPALVRTAEGMNAFALADDSPDPLHLRQYLPPDLDVVKVEETDEDAADAMDVGDKRPWNGLDDRPRKRQRQDNSDPHLWWAAVHSDALLPNGLPAIAHRSSRPLPSSQSPAAAPLKRRRKRKKDKEAKEKTLLALMNNNIRTMRRLRHTHARFAALGLSAGAPATDEFDQGGMPPPPLPPLGLPPAPLQAGLLSMPELPEREEDAVVGENEVDDRPWGIELDDEPPDIEVGAANADQCMRWMGSKVLEHAGFQGTSNVALDVLASVTSEYLLNVGRTIRYLSDKYSQTMTPEEIILHTLFESGISRVQDVERYISDDVERHGTRLGDLEKKLVGAYREVTAVDVLDDEGLFEDEEEEGGALTMGDFADVVGEDYLGLRELGIAAEFGMSSLSIPKKLLRGKRRVGMGAAPPPLPYPLPPPLIPLTAAKVDSQIGLLRPYYMGRFTLIAAAAAAASAPPTLLQPPLLPGPSLPGLPALPGPSSLPGTLPLPIATPTPTPMPPPPPPPPPPVIQPYLELPDDPPSAMQAKMGPLGQILLAKTGAKKKVAAGGGAGSALMKGKPDGGPASGVTLVAAEKKKKKSATGVGTGNGRKKSGNGGDGALMPPPPVQVHVGMV
ncbi:hypothetical protein DFH08DRAFT_700766 [Mycena albidolilacea]|uniref:Bromo domain-containing protein n=1 Tax=Mycena albidolilacea TaxID=1033008 RepID=A0AAD7EQ26_9AGAR|nr:hypothetical protein DFH08DRAFT_700766 [Mycena albidolilacea]